MLMSFTARGGPPKSLSRGRDSWLLTSKCSWGDKGCPTTTALFPLHNPSQGVYSAPENKAIFPWGALHPLKCQALQPLGSVDSIFSASVLHGRPKGTRKEVNGSDTRLQRLEDYLMTFLFWRTCSFSLKETKQIVDQAPNSGALRTYASVMCSCELHQSCIHLLIY